MSDDPGARLPQELIGTRSVTCQDSNPGLWFRVENAAATPHDPTSATVQLRHPNTPSDPAPGEDADVEPAGHHGDRGVLDSRHHYHDPQLVVCYEKEVKIDEVTFLICGEFWPSKSSQKVYTAALFILCYLGPLLIISVLYYKIAMRVWFKPRPGENNGSNRSTSSRQACLGSVSERRGRVVRMVITMVMVFALTWLPLYVCWLMEEYGSLSQMQEISLHHYGYPIVHLVAFSNSCIDPLVYGIFTANFRQIFNRGGRGGRGGAGNIRATHPTGPDFAISPPSGGNSNFRWNLFAGNARHVGSTPNKPSSGGYSTARTSPDFNNAATSFSLFTMNASPLNVKNNDIDLDVFLPRVETAESVSNLV
ncbi:G-protein coupled receptor [Branchiostoma belcheri]|nr:G-protein coupled receptor [Branchiostoma belcheri]